MQRGRPSIYTHILRSMRAGDVVYLPSRAKRFDRHISGVAYNSGGKVSTANFVAVKQVPELEAVPILRVEIIKPLKSK